MFIKPENAKKTMVKLAESYSSRYLAKVLIDGNVWSFGSSGYVLVAYKTDFGFPLADSGFERLLQLVFNATPEHGYTEMKPLPAKDLRAYFKTAKKAPMYDSKVFFAGQFVDPDLALSVLKHTQTGLVRIASRESTNHPIVLSVDDIWCVALMPCSVPRSENNAAKEYQEMFWKRGDTYPLLIDPANLTRDAVQFLASP